MNSIGNYSFKGRRDGRHLVLSMPPVDDLTTADAAPQERSESSAGLDQPKVGMGVTDGGLDLTPVADDSSVAQ